MVSWVKEWICIFLKLALIAITKSNLTDFNQMMVMMVMVMQFRESNAELNNQNKTKKIGSQAAFRFSARIDQSLF